MKYTMRVRRPSGVVEEVEGEVDLTVADVVFKTLKQNIANVGKGDVLSCTLIDTVPTPKDPPVYCPGCRALLLEASNLGYFYVKGVRLSTYYCDPCSRIRGVS